MENQSDVNVGHADIGTNVKLHKEKIVDMVNKIDDEKFLNQIRIILKRHIEKRGG